MNLKQLKAVWKAAKIERKRSGKSRLYLAYDIVRARREQGTDLADYMSFGFSMLDKCYRDRYFSVHPLYVTVNQVNNRKKEDKWLAYQLLKPYYKRDVVHLEESAPEEVSAFLEKHKTFFAKAPNGTGGDGVEYIKGRVELVELKQKGLLLLEEPIVQHEALNALTDACVNTLRIFSIRSKSGEVVFLPSILRVGLGTLKVDNISSGGTYTLLDEAGVVKLDGYYQENLDYIQNDSLLVQAHPVTGFRPKGFQVPYYKESLDMVEEMATILDDCQLLGWDIAIGEDGPQLLEFNSFPAIGLHQNYYFTEILNRDEVGARPIVEKQLGRKIELEHRLFGMSKTKS